MPIPNENQTAVTVLRAKVECHPMCAHFSQSATHYTAVYPQGDFPVGGVRANKGAGLAVALTRLLERMERDWLESFPVPPGAVS